MGFMPFQQPDGQVRVESFFHTGIAAGFALVLCCLAWMNLIRDVERGYAPNRCSIAALVMLIATIAPFVALWSRGNAVMRNGVRQ